VTSTPPLEAQLPHGTAVIGPFVQVHFDGACLAAPGGGIATYGLVVEGDGIFHEECGLAVRPGSPNATNNVAEYTGAIRALEWLRGRAYPGSVLLCGDSQLVIRQMSGEYEVRAEHLRAYHDHLEALAQGFIEVRYEWVPREQNTRADELSKIALREARSETGRPRRSVGRTSVLSDGAGSSGSD
jgi:ribonuclease HI